MKAVPKLITLLFIVLLSLPTQGQEEEFVVTQGKKYLDLNISSLEKCNKRIQKQQGRLLQKLSKKERHYATRLKRKDSAGYVRYQQQTVSFDSINKLNKNKSAIHSVRTKGSAAIDSLTAIQQFLQTKAPNGNNDALSKYTDQLNKLKSDQQHNNQVGELISQRFNTLKGINADAKGIKGFKGIDKQVFYAKERIKVFKQINDEPSKVEEQALEVLQGQQGFDQLLDKTTGRTATNSNMSASDLEKMGYQTKKQVTVQLKQKFGGNLDGIQQSMGKQITDYQDKLKDVKATTGKVKQSKQSLSQLKNINKPSFRVNPMRGMPLSKRIEKQWNFQTNRATIDGKPAMLQLSAMVGFKHTPKLIYGAGIATSIGLGQNWNNIRFSFEGIGVRTFAEWQWLYGIGAYAGYERMFKQATFIKTNETIPPVKGNAHNTNTYNESVLIGLTKRYRISDKMSGSIQLLYDVWYKEKGLRTPLQLRIATLKN